MQATRMPHHLPTSLSLALSLSLPSAVKFKDKAEILDDMAQKKETQKEQEKKEGEFNACQFPFKLAAWKRTAHGKR